MKEWKRKEIRFTSFKLFLPLDFHLNDRKMEMEQKVDENLLLSLSLFLTIFLSLSSELNSFQHSTIPSNKSENWLGNKSLPLSSVSLLFVAHSTQSILSVLFVPNNEASSKEDLAKSKQEGLSEWDVDFFRSLSLFHSL